MPTLKAEACVNYLNDWYRLNQQEKNYLLMNPWHLLAIKESANKALNEAQSKFGAGSLHNGAGDAFRHCYWSALLARDIGPDAALAFTTAHEEKPGLPKTEIEMDLFNNRVGIEIGRQSVRESDFIVASKCLNALTNKRLKVLK